MKSRFSAIFVAVITVALLPVGAAAADKVVAQSRSDTSLRQELDIAIGKGLTWLAGQQKPDGAWGMAEFPALSGLALTAFQGDPTGFYKNKYEANISKGYEQLLSHVQPDGGIYVEKLANYNTSISMMALLVANNPAYEPILKKARQFEIGQQDLRSGDDAVSGGIGYGGSYHHSDLSNTTYALEALHFTQYLKSDVANDPEAKDLNWKAAIQFISRTQNLPGSNDQKWASGDPDNKGGFIYFPGDSKAGEQKLENGKTALRSYGSMSYAGLLSFIYAQVDKNDPRVKAVIDWLSRNYTLAENPGMGQEGLYYYYHTMAKALSAAGIDTLTLKDGTKVNWRQDLAKRLLNLQNADGSWVNQSGRWMERDPTLATAYGVITLEILHHGL
jgi:squalene-hopene/tetraprenyl-beta-curcumene cyclase